MITYVFPPAAWVGGHRTLKYCKYLGSHGWTPIVLTAKPIGVAFQDQNLVRQLPPEVTVYRTLDLDPAKWEEKLYAHRLQRPKHPESKVSASGNLATARPATGIFSRAKRLLKALLKDSPDSHIFWAPFALFRGVAILLSKKVDVIYCSTPPHSSHVVAYLLAKCSGKPYVLDFRDPWYVAGSARQPDGKIPMLLKLETHLKQLVVRGAAKVICVSRGEREELQAEFPDLGDNHFTHITNGYDPSDLPEAAPIPTRSPRLQFIHAGTIYPGIADEFFEALRRLLDEHPATAQAMQVNLVGEIAYDYLDVVRSLEDRGIVKVHGFQPHAKTLQMVQASDVPVILMGGTKYLPSHLPSKAFEYLHAAKPILAIAREGELAEMLRQSGLGIVVAPHVVDSLVEALQGLVADHAASRYSRVPNLDYIGSFERGKLAARLADILDSVREAALVRR